jgi:hypothetical protein
VFPERYEHHLHIKIKAIPVTGRVGLKSYQMLRIPHCLESRITDGCEVVSFTHRLRSTPYEYFLFFLSLVLISVKG